MAETLVGGLRWVKDEIAATLRRVTELVDAYGRTGEPTALGDAEDALFEVHGVLLVLRLTEPARLVDEMQQLREAMANGQVRSPKEATEAMMLALIRLPDHLDQLDAAAAVHPATLWQTINDLREARGAQPLAEEENPPPDIETLSAIFRKVRPHLHRSLVEWCRPATGGPGLVKLRHLFFQVHHHLKDGILADLFRLAEAYAGALQGGEVAADASARTLVGGLDRILKPLVASPPQWPGADARQLRDAFLGALTRAAIQAPLVAEIQSHRYGAVAAPPEPPQGTSAALAGLALVILDKLAGLKGQLSLFVQGGGEDRAPLDEISATLRDLARTLEVADASRLPERMRILADDIGELSAADAAEDALGAELLATELLGIEAALHAYAQRRAQPTGDVNLSGSDTAEIQSATLREACVEFEHVKAAILDCQPQGAHPETFRTVPGRLSNVAGALLVLGDAPAAQIAEAIAALMRRRYLAADRWPRGDEFEFLADAITALELHIERVKEGQPKDDDLIRQAANAVRTLDELLSGGRQLIPPPSPAPSESPGDAGLVPLAAAPGPADPGQSGTIAPEFIDIFLEEAREETQTIGEQFGRWRSNPADNLALATLRRSFHTLKGSGRLVGARRIGDLALAAETLFSQLIDQRLTPDAPLLAYLNEVVEQLPLLVTAETQGHPLDIAGLVARAAQFDRPAGGAASAPAAPLIQPTGAAVSPGPPDSDAGAAPRLTDQPSVFAADDTLLEIFREETSKHLDDVRAFLARASADAAVPDEDTVRALHTLNGSARMAGIDSIADVAQALEQQLQTRRAASLSLTAPLLDLLKRAVDGMTARVAEIPVASGGAAELIALTEDLAAFAAAAKAPPGASVRPAVATPSDLAGLAPPPTERVSTASLPIGEDAVGDSCDFGETFDDPEAMRFIDDLPELTPVTLSDSLASAFDAGALIDPFADHEAMRADGDLPELTPLPLGHPVAPAPGEGAMIDPFGDDEAISADSDVPELGEWAPLALAGDLADALPRLDVPARSFADQVDAGSVEVEEWDGWSGAGGEVQRPGVAAEAAIAASPSPFEPTPEPVLAVAPKPVPTDLGGAVPTAQAGSGDALATPTGAAAEPGLAAPELADLDAHPADPEQVSLFLEEARDLLDGIDTKIRAWQRAPQESAILDDINRLLHTLKGSARITGLRTIGDLSHDLETRLTADWAARGRVDADTLDLAQQAVDTLSLQVDALRQRAPSARAPVATTVVSAAPQPSPAGPTPAPSLAMAFPVVAPQPLPGAFDPRGSAGRTAGAGTPAAKIRVPSNLLDRLVDSAGEIGLNRARLSQRNGLLGFSLGELDQTVGRLRDQLRRLEIETETQILFRFEREGAPEAGGQVFDPLELDRFSTLQQLSRSLAETVHDLVSLRNVLGTHQRESTDLLTQQARLADDLQDGLLRTRMVPFVQMVPQLHRLVRQTADSLGKSARLEVIGPEVELDRVILNRLAAPLEHLLRNAVDHGLESSAGRAAAGKPTTGQVTLELSREGNGVVIKLGDDGRGLDLAAIRTQAMARGLLDPQVALADAALMQFVFAPGFTTRHEVTQISGRGVGLDVVASEIKAANGTIDLHSSPGHGTSFTVRVPLTLVIVKALLVGVGGTVYAVPHTTIEGVARISREDLTAIYQGNGRDFDYRGQAYRVAYVGSLLDARRQPDLGDSAWAPLLLARFGDLGVALQVDTLLESSRILVKPLGARLAALRWLAGGTILPDGRVGLILDVPALLRSGTFHHLSPGPEPTEAAPPPVCVMVVDDSLTVRVVTTRMLQHRNIEVITAKDGVEALTMLNERRPDLLLLDIEMPRMDGYELTRHIRGSRRLRGLPIIMITSRTGAKHRDHGLALGVNRFLGKPYQESELLAEIASLLAEQRR